MVYLQSSLLILVLNTSVINSKIIVQRMESQLHSAHHTTTKQIVLLREQLEHANHYGRKLLKVASVHITALWMYRVTPLDNHLPSPYGLLYGHKPKTLMPFQM